MKLSTLVSYTAAAVTAGFLLVGPMKKDAVAGSNYQNSSDASFFSPDTDALIRQLEDSIAENERQQELELVGTSKAFYQLVADGKVDLDDVLSNLSRYGAPRGQREAFFDFYRGQEGREPEFSKSEPHVDYSKMGLTDLIRNVNSLDGEALNENYFALSCKKEGLTGKNMNLLIREYLKSDGLAETMYVNILRDRGLTDEEFERVRSKLKASVESPIDFSAESRVTRIAFDDFKENSEVADYMLGDVVSSVKEFVSLVDVDNRFVEINTRMIMHDWMMSDYLSPEELASKVKEVRQAEAEYDRMNHVTIKHDIISKLLAYDLFQSRAHDEFMTKYGDKPLPKVFSVDLEITPHQKRLLQASYWGSVEILSSYLSSKGIEMDPEAVKNDLAKFSFGIDSQGDWDRRMNYEYGKLGYAEPFGNIESYASNDPNTNVGTLVHEQIHKLYTFVSTNVWEVEGEFNLLPNEFMTELMTRCAMLEHFGIDSDITVSDAGKIAWPGVFVKGGYSQLMNDGALLRFTHDIGQDRLVASYSFGSLEFEGSEIDKETGNDLGTRFTNARMKDFKDLHNAIVNHYKENR